MTAFARHCHVGPFRRDAILIGPRETLERIGRFDITPREGGPTATIPRALLEAMLIDTPMR